MTTTTQHPSSEERTSFAIRAFKGIEVGLGLADPTAAIAAKLEAQHPGHLVLVQAGKFLHGFDRTAYALATLKKYKLKLVGIATEPHLRIGFPAGNFKRRLWPIVDEFGIPYVVALGTQASGHTVYISTQPNANAGILSAVSDQIVQQCIADLRQHGELNKAAVAAMLANGDQGFQLKTRTTDLDTQILLDIVKMPRDIRCTYGENLRACMARITRNVMAYGLEENKPALLRSLSADVDCLKHYISQAPRLNGFEFNFEHRASLAVELGRLVGGLLRAQRIEP